jgi:hypothetical protein
MSKTLEDIYQSCDISNNRTDDPLSLEEFKTELLALLLGEDAPRDEGFEVEPKDEWDFSASVGGNKASAAWRQHIRNKLGGQS